MASVALLLYERQTGLRMLALQANSCPHVVGHVLISDNAGAREKPHLGAISECERDINSMGRVAHAVETHRCDAVVCDSGLRMPTRMR